MSTASTTTPPTSPLTSASPAELLFPDLAHELSTTRRVLERVPEDKFAWQPHEKSMRLDRLAIHLAELPRFATIILTTDELDFAAAPYVAPELSTTAGLLALFDEKAAEMRVTLAGATWDALGKRWTMRAGSEVYANDVKATLLRTFGINHIAHHRAQLGVYLRLLGVAIPGSYGPSADEM